MIAVQIRDWALGLYPEYDTIEGYVELAVDTAELIERCADLPRHLAVIARCGMRGCRPLPEVWLEPLYMRPDGSPRDATALEVHPLLDCALADWRVMSSALRVMLEDERYRQERLMEVEADEYEMEDSPAAEEIERGEHRK